MLSFKSTFLLFSFTLIKRLFSSSSLSAIRVASSAYLRLLLFLLAILIPGCTSFSLTFHILYSTYQLNKQGNNIQHWPTPFPIWKQTVISHPILTVVYWHAYRFLRRLVRWSGITISSRIFYSFFFMIQTFKGFSVVKEAEADVFCNSLAFSMIQQMLTIWTLCFPNTVGHLEVLG